MGVEIVKGEWAILGKVWGIPL